MFIVDHVQPHFSFYFIASSHFERFLTLSMCLWNSNTSSSWNRFSKLSINHSIINQQKRNRWVSGKKSRKKIWSSFILEEMTWKCFILDNSAMKNGKRWISLIFLFLIWLFGSWVATLNIIRRSPGFMWHFKRNSYTTLNCDYFIFS